MVERTFIKLLKEYTLIDKDFIDTFFKKFDIGDDLEFHIKDIDAADYLNITIDELRKKLRNEKTKNNKNNMYLYYEKVDYIKKTKNRKVSYMLNYKCFERVAMNSRTEEGEAVKFYYIKLREFITDYNKILLQALNKNTELQKTVGQPCIYIVSVNDKVFKIGRTINIINRLRNYNVGKLEDTDLKYLAVVSNPLLIENCMKNVLKKYSAKKNTEMFELPLGDIKKVITDCYCKHTSYKEHKKLYQTIPQELLSIIDLYTFSKNNSNNIKPYVIIDF